MRFVQRASGSVRAAHSGASLKHLHVAEGDLHRRLLPFVAFQGAVSTLIGFGGLLVFVQDGALATVHFAVSLLTATVFAITVPYLLGRWMPMQVRHVVRLCFAIPAVLLWWADGRPVLLAVACGGFLGASWSARLWLELSLLQDAQRDAYATRMTVWTVLSSLLATLLVSAALSWAHEAAFAVYASYAVIAALAVFLAPRAIPSAPLMRLRDPVSVLRQPAYVQSLPLYFLESGLMGVGMVINASGAVQALGRASHYGWAVSAATVVGALSLYAVRTRRHGGNRVRWMGVACLGMVAGQSLLAASVWMPLLYVSHVLLLACAQPFWQASEQVLNQRALDLHGDLADRIVVREWTLWLFRCTALLAFWWLVQGWSATRQLVLGVALMALATVLEWMLARRWLRTT